MGIHIYFNLAKIIYSCSTRWQRRFLLLETLGSLVIIFLSQFFQKNIYVATSKIVSFFCTSSSIYNSIYTKLGVSLFWGVIFITISFASRLLVKENPIEVVHAPKNKRIIPIGIIDFSWLFIIGISYSLVLFANLFPVISDPLKSGLPKDYYSLYFTEVNYLMGKSIDMVIILGSVLSACMAIIWGGELWRKRDPQQRNHYFNTTFSSIKMVIAFFIVAIAVVIWVTLPLYLKMTELKMML